MSDIKSNIQSIEDKAESVRKRAAETLESAAETVRSVGHDSAETITGFTSEASRKLDSTAAFVRNTCVKERMIGGFRNLIRRNPMSSLAVVAALGLVAGFSCRPMPAPKPAR